MIARLNASAYRTTIASSLISVVGAGLLGAVLLVLTGHDPWTVYRLIAERGLLNGDAQTESLKRMAPILTITAGLLVCLRAGIWNIGIDGQVVIGAIACGAIAGNLSGSVARPVVLVVALLGAGLAGSLWAIGPAVLKVRFGLNEIIVTVMMNYLAFNLVSWLVKGPLKDKDLVASQTPQIPLTDRLPIIPGTEVHIGLLIGIVAIVGVTILFRSSVAGVMLDVLGRNRRAAEHTGLPVTRLIFWAFVISGLTAGLGGAIDVLGIFGSFKSSYQPGYGFTAFALAYLARLRTLAVIPFALLLSVLAIGGESMSRRADVPTEFVSVLEGLMLLLFAITVWFESRRAT